MIHIRVFEAGEWPVYKQLRLSALADSPEAYGSSLAAEAQGTDEQWSSRLAAGVGSERHLPLLAVVDGQPAGLAWGRRDDTDPALAHLHQVWVAPSYRGRGVGQRLLATAIAWAAGLPVDYLDLGVTCGDTPAMRLYARAGFVPHGAPEPLRPGAERFFQPMRLVLKPSHGD